MGWIARAFSILRTWWRRRRRRRSFAGVVRLDSDVDPANELAAARLVLVGPEGKPKWLRLQCPCRCGQVIALNLMPSHRPRWKVEEEPEGEISVHPSVNSRSCGAHFWIRKNQIQWV